MEKEMKNIGFFKIKKPGYAILFLFAVAFAGIGHPALAQTERYVEALRPVGYWPADEGHGEILHDRSGHGNHGSLFHIPWSGDLPDFSGFTYQWAQLPNPPQFRSEAFSLGGWVFSRSRGYAYHGMLFIGQQFHATPNPPGLRWGGLGNALSITNTPGIRIYLGGASFRETDMRVGIISGGNPDAIGSMAAGIVIASGQWQHLLYTYEAGTGKVYLNGQLAMSANQVSFNASDMPFIVGSDLGAWGVWPPGTRSLDGSIQNMVLFDRALSPSEVERLYQSTRPTVHPSIPGQNAMAGDQTPPSVKTPTIPLLIQTLRDANHTPETRAKAALSLAGMRTTEAVPALMTVLENIVQQEGAHFPKIEDVLRNAVMRALLDIAPQNRRVRRLLGTALARPLMQTLDLSKPHLKAVQSLVGAGRYLDALDAFREHSRLVPSLPGHAHWGYAAPDSVRKHLPLRAEYFDALVSKGNPFSDGPYTTPGSRPADYTPIDVHAGTTFMTVVERLSQIQAEEEFGKSLKHLATEPPDPEAKWSRVKILKIAPDGAEEEALLEGAWFIFDARDEKMDGWAVGIDQDGYIHLVGGQHNTPNKRYYMPGIWEKMGLDATPGVMYWVSKTPGDIHAFEFMGRREHPRTIPCGWMNYMNFVRSPGGTLFLYGRDHIWTWGLYRYDAPTRQWTALGETPTAMLEKARNAIPEWAGYTEPVRSAIGPSGRRVLVYAWQPGAYNFNRSRWGVRFDRTGRMHIQVPIRGVGEAAQMSDGPVYAYSDDLGDSFHRADGAPLSLPLTVNPVPGHQADITVHTSRQWFDLWISLLGEAGYKDP